MKTTRQKQRQLAAAQNRALRARQALSAKGFWPVSNFGEVGYLVKAKITMKARGRSIYGPKWAIMAFHGGIPVARAKLALRNRNERQILRTLLALMEIKLPHPG